MELIKYTSFKSINLDKTHSILSGYLPNKLIPGNDLFSELWNVHPNHYHSVRILNKIIKTPRWQQAYNKTYQYSGSSNFCLSVPNILKPYWDWCKKIIDPRLNGLLLNWYDGKLGHYIGKHQDSTINMVKDAPIVTISFGEKRIFRFRPYKKTGFQDFTVDNGSVFIVPYSTNQEWTHEIPKSKKLQGRRISLTLRAFL